MMSQTDIKDQALMDRDLLLDVLEIKKAFFNSSYANYHKCEHKQFQLLPNDVDKKHLETDYIKMIHSAMFLNQPIQFSEVMSRLKSLQDELNQM